MGAAPPSEPVEDLDASDGDMAEAVGEPAEATTTLPPELAAGRKVGDVVTLTIRSVSEDGSAQAAAVEDEAAPPTMASALESVPS